MDNNRGRETVVLLPGLWLHAGFMRLLAHRIARHGYDVRCYSYRSVHASLDESGEALAAYCTALRATTLHLVGHSLGGAIALHAVHRAPELAVGRIVLIGTPFAGCHAAVRFARYPGARKLLGRSLPQWLAQQKPALEQRCEIGVVAGNMGIGLGRLVAPDLPAPNDGVVTLAETEVPYMRDRVVLRTNHSGMIFSAAVARQVCAFLRSGRFSAAAEATR